MLTYLLCAVLLGGLTEALAYALSLWWYHRAWMRLPNILLMFGLVYGGLAWLLAGQPWWWSFTAGAALGLAYEVANDRWLKLWYFPGEPWAFLKGQPAVMGVGLAWGFVPLLVQGLVWLQA